MKKNKTAITLLIIAVILFSAIGVYKVFNGGIRGGDAYQESLIEAYRFSSGSEEAENFLPLSEITKCNDKICLQVFEKEESNLIHCAAFEEKTENMHIYTVLILSLKKKQINRG